jgi:NADPH-dependent 7-cyano-7-deazaguanine reductase QueF
MNDMVAACQPRWLPYWHFNIRGGIDFVITARFTNELKLKLVRSRRAPVIMS